MNLAWAVGEANIIDSARGVTPNQAQSVDHRLVGGIEGVLQVHQTSDQARGQCWAATGGGEVSAKAALDLAPVDQRSQAY